MAWMKLKRKELEEVNDDFSSFSLSSPATKIRRLDAELAPVIEEEEMVFPFVPPSEHVPGGMWLARNLGPIIEELPTEPENEERSLVLFKSMNSIHSPKSFSVSVDPSLLSRIKNEFWSNKSTPIEPSEDESVDNSNTRDECLAVVPWAPSKIPSAPENKVSDLMDADDMEVTLMDIEEEDASSDHVQACVYNNSVPNPDQGLHHLQQQHCFIPQVPQKTPTPIMSFR